MPTMTKKRFAILRYLAESDAPVSPTKIGQDVGPLGAHSSWSSPACLAMVEDGLLRRIHPGRYEITKAGREACAGVSWE